ncbi:MAG: hypothetical protein WC939_00710 [Acholeplasmataceae bacterium]
MLEFINYLTDIQIETPTFYGWFHLTFLGISILVSFLIAFLPIKTSHKQQKVLLIIVLVIFYVGELYKQYDYYHHGSWGIGITNTYHWGIFPFQFCSTHLYLLPLLFIPNDKVKNPILTYLATFGLFAGLITMIYPMGVFKDRLFVSIHTMVHHSLMIWVGIYVWKIKRVGDFKCFLKACLILLIFMVTAILINLLLNDVSESKVRMFYMHPFVETSLPVFNYIQRVSFLLYVVVYYALFTLVGFSIFRVGSKLNGRTLLSLNEPLHY